jgi:hypothetical protein
MAVSLSSGLMLMKKTLELKFTYLVKYGSPRLRALFHAAY